MKKLLFITVMLISLNLYSYHYLKLISEKRRPYQFDLSKQSFIYRKKDLVLQKDEDFLFDEYFGFVSLEEPSYRYSLNEETVDIYLNGEKHSYAYEIKEPEVVEVEKVVTVEVPVYINANVSGSSTSATYSAPVQSSYFHINSTSYSFQAGTDLDQIIAVIRNAVDSSQEMTIDFSSLNPNVCGSYPVYFITDSNSAVITINIT